MKTFFNSKCAIRIRVNDNLTRRFTLLTLQGRGGKKPEIATVIAPYSATSGEQLSLQRGQLLMIRKKSASGWWEGELQAKGRNRQIGWFPASYVKVLSSTGGSSRTTPVPMENDDGMVIPTAALPTASEINAAITEVQQSHAEGKWAVTGSLSWTITTGMSF